MKETKSGSVGLTVGRCSCGSACTVAAVRGPDKDGISSTVACLRGGIQGSEWTGFLQTSSGTRDNHRVSTLPSVITPPGLSLYIHPDAGRAVLVWLLSKKSRMCRKRHYIEIYIEITIATFSSNGVLPVHWRSPGFTSRVSSPSMCNEALTQWHIDPQIIGWRAVCLSLFTLKRPRDSHLWLQNEAHLSTLAALLGTFYSQIYAVWFV